MQRVIVFSVPSAALGKLNQKPVKLTVTLDNLDDCSAIFLITFTFPHLHEEKDLIKKKAMVKPFLFFLSQNSLFLLSK